ncbi:autotransporter-associated beta strand repeat-containing protein [Mesorhizobium sp. B2-4-19]|uniref:autotransporter-associated beta strand repeat-containing protein n=1 Tax=Mesorhizobium sp. B2-4-19 TaxID=2589930 RepID=UPI0015E479BB|nr:autotransporter-associated beta strand repeat-containing protein [Mesorhizobium sp. B2-4-19]
MSLGDLLRAALLASTALTVAAYSAPARAQDATWLASPADGNYNNDANWNSGTAPTGTATFDASSVTSLVISVNTTLGGWTFDPGGPDYDFSNGSVLAFNGAGMAANGGRVAITNNGGLYFHGNSSAGSAAITNRGYLAFYDNSTAGGATITNTSIVDFNNASTAGSAVITNDGNLHFLDASTAGSAAITNNANLFFYATGTAGNAAITNDNYLSFNNASTAGNAAITNASNSRLYFYDTSTAGNAAITNNYDLTFWDASTAGDAAIANNSGGIVDFSYSTGPNGDHKLSAGSIAGPGSYVLGANQLTVGSNGLSTEVSGVISGNGGSLVKIGTGTLTLSGTNSYSGGTTIAGGILQLGNADSTGAIIGAVTLGSGGRFDVVNADTSGITGLTNAGGIVNVGDDNMLAGSISNTGAGRINLGARATLYDTGSVLYNDATINVGTDGIVMSNGDIHNNAGGVINFNGPGGTAQLSPVSSVYNSGQINVIGGDVRLGLSYFNNQSGGSVSLTGGDMSWVNDFTNSAGATLTVGAGRTLDVQYLNFYGGTATGAGTIKSSSGIYLWGPGTIGTTLTGTASLSKGGPGTTILTGAHSYTGGTTVNAGTLQLGDSNTAGAILGAVNVTSYSGTFDVVNADTSGITSITNSGTTNFRNGTNAGSAAIINNYGLYFWDASTGGSAAITNNGDLSFSDASTAGSATIANNGNLYFWDTSSGGSAAITNNGNLSFHVSSTAGNATITNSDSMIFLDVSTAGNATITNNDGLSFYGSSTAGGATITNNAVVSFVDNSTASAATIINNAGLYFYNTSTAGNAAITNNGNLYFYDSSTAGSAAITNGNSDGKVDFSTSTGPNGDGRISAGSIAGPGSYILGANELTVGSNGLSTEVSGVISGNGGSLVKIGAGTLTLSGANTYSGGTTINGGILQFGNASGTGSILGDVVNNGVLAFNRSDVAIFSGVISGSGAVRQIGAGTTILTGTNIYTGGTAIDAGTLQLGELSAAGTILSVVNVGSGGTFDIVNADTSGITGIMNAGTTNFRNGTSAGSATITNDGYLSFYDNSTGGGAAITNAGDGYLYFRGNSTAGNATITNSGGMAFYDSSTAGSAAIANNPGGIVDFSGSSGPNGDHRLSAGSIAGAGSYNLSGNELTVGSNGFSTEVSGVISGTGGALVKIGAGMLTLAGTSTYTGGTTINAGTLQLGDSNTAGAILGAVNVGSSGTFDIVNADTSGITGIVNAGTTNFRGGTSTGSATIISNYGLYFWDASTGGSAAITNNGSLYFSDNSTAGNAGITNASNGYLAFRGSSTAGSATIVNNGGLDFDGSSTAGRATITNNAGLYFYSASTGGNAAITNNLGAAVDFSGSTGPNGDHKLSAGSIAGVGNYILGANELTVGSNGLSTEVSGVISGNGGSLVKIGTGTLTLSRANTYNGGTTIDGGILQLGNGGGTGSILGDVVNNGVLAFNRSDVVTFSGVISGSGAVRQIGWGTTILTGTNTYTGGTTIAGRTLQLGNGGGTGSILGNIVNDGVLTLNRTGTLTLAGDISGSGAVQQIGPGTTILTGTNSYSGDTLVTDGRLQFGDGSAGGSNRLGGNLVVAGGTLAIQTPATVSVSQAVTFGDSTALSIVAGANSPALSANSVAISNNVALNISGIGDASQLDKVLIDTASGIGGDFASVTVGGFSGTVDYLTVSTRKSANNLQYLASYGLSWTANNNLAHGTFTLTNPTDNFTVGAALADQAANPATGWNGAALTKAGAGKLILTANNTYTGGTTIADGTLQIGDAAHIGAILGSVTVGSSGTFDVVNADTGGVTGITNAGTTKFRNATSAGSAAIANSGTLTFYDTSTAGSAAVTNYSSLSFYGGSTGGNAGITNASNGYLAFNDGSTAGNATIANSGALYFYGTSTAGNAAITNNSGGNVDFSGTTGPNGDRRLSAGSIAGAGTYDFGGNELTVGSNGFSTEVSGVISGVGGSLVKTGIGTLTLSGANTYSGGTTISYGTLQLGDGGSTGAIVGNVVNNGTLAFNRSDVVTFSGDISGSGQVQQIGLGTLTLTGTNTYSGGTTISGGTTLQLGNGGSTGSIVGNVVNDGVLAFNRSAAMTFSGAISGSGAVQQIGQGTTILTGSNTYAGGTTISGGTLQIGNAGATGSITGNVANNGTLAFDRSDTFTFAGVMSGNGALNQIGSGTTTLTGANSSVGTVTVSNGTLVLGQTGVFSATAYTTRSGAVTAIGANAQLAVTAAFTQDAGSTLSVTLGANQPIVTADSASLGGTLNIAGLTASTSTASALAGTQFTVIATTNGISGDFANVIVGGSSNPVDYLTAAGSKSANNLDYNVGLGLTWAAGAARGNGAFTLANGTDAFTIDMALTNQAGPFVSGWDGTSLTKNGDGTLTLSAMNTYTGATTINGGTLAITATGGITSDVTNNATFRNAGAVTGSVTNNAGATFTQTEGNVSNGVVNFGSVNANGGALNGAIANNAGGIFNVGGTLTSDSTFNNANGATLAVSATGDYSLAGLLTNSGAVTVAAGGSLTAPAGILNNAGGIITNNGTVTDALNNAGLVTNNGVYNANVASNTGTINNAASGIWTGNFNTAGIVNNDGTINGSLTQTAGTTTNNGNITGAVTVSGGLFTGTGSAGGLTIASGASVAPGIGTINVGNIAFNPGSTYQVAVNAAGQGSRINATGTIAITGGAVNVLAGSGNYAPSTTYTILSTTTNGGRTGTFDNVSSNLAFLTPTLGYGASDVTLTMTRNHIDFTAIGVTANQIATGGGVESLGRGNPIYNAVLNLSAPQAQGAFGQLSGEIHASAKSALIEDSRFVRNAVNDRIRAAFDAVGASGTVTTYVDGKPMTVKANTDRFAVWGQGFGSWGHTNGDGNAATLNRKTGGFFVGADAPVFDTWRFGAVAGYSRTDFDVKSRHSSGSSDNYHLGLYGGTAWGDLAFRTGVAYAWHDISTSRNVMFPGLNDSLKGDYNAATAQVFGELAYAFNAGGARFEPFANLAYVNLHTDGFTERGGAAALTSPSSNTDATFTTLGLRGSTTFDLGGTMLTANGMLGWRHAFSDVTPLSTMRFAGSGDAFSIAGVPITRDAAVIEAGINYAITPNATLGVSYGGQFGSRMSDQSARANFNVRF